MITKELRQFQYKTYLENYIICNGIYSCYYIRNIDLVDFEFFLADNNKSIYGENVEDIKFYVDNINNNIIGRSVPTTGFAYTNISRYMSNFVDSSVIEGSAINQELINFKSLNVHLFFNFILFKLKMFKNKKLDRVSYLPFYLKRNKGGFIIKLGLKERASFLPKSQNTKILKFYKTLKKLNFNKFIKNMGSQCVPWKKNIEFHRYLIKFGQVGFYCKFRYGYFFLRNRLTVKLPFLKASKPFIKNKIKLRIKRTFQKKKRFLFIPVVLLLTSGINK